MRNYIILNGNNSNEITGLLIQSLPPISQPKIRTNIEEIDGRDGDIITKLGYSAYNKEISIGLYGSYNVDDVIAYFTNNQSGNITFSNEPNKYYNYEILDQIDFEKLIRFKTATITLHIQPFKYSTTDTPETFAITSQTSISITNSGNYISKPLITLTGSGTINLSLNNEQLFVIDLGTTSTQITLDIANMNAYNPSTNAYMNRDVTGDYNNFALSVGSNTISWTGTITQITISDYSRWI
jgi:predicted phage tail component-like protein